MPAMTAVNNWFVRRRGLALGLLMGGFGIGGTIGVPFLGWFITQTDWRTAAVVVGLAFWVVGIPAAFVIKHRPEDQGLRPDGLPPATLQAGGASGPMAPLREVAFTARQALATQAFWLLSIVFAIRQLVSSAVAVHEVPFFVNRHFSLEDASIILGVTVLISITGRVFWGWLGDRWDRRWVLVLCHTLIAMGVVLMTMIPDANSPDRLNLVVRVVAFLLVFGIGYGGTIPVSLALMADFFGRRSYATIQGWSSMVTMLGNVIGPTLAGYVFDVSQSYEIALISFAIATVAGMPLFWLVRRPALRPAAATGGV
jgi:MFS family permease